MSDTEETWGESKLDNEGGYPKTFKITQGKTADEETHNVFRILPAMKNQLKTGKIAEFHKIHYGYYVANPRHPDDPTKRLSKSFVCIEVMDFSTKMITTRCPECDNIKMHQEELKETEASFDLRVRDIVKKMRADGKSEKEIATKTRELAKEKEIVLSPLKDWLKSHNQERKWHVNVKSQATGGLGDLHVSNNLWKSIKTELKKKQEQWRCDPLAPNKGVWIDIVRTGNGSGIAPGSTAQDKVEIVTEPVDPNNPTAGDKAKLAPLTKEDAEKAKTACRDVADPSPAVRLDAEIIEMLVNCDESPEEVAKIFGLRETHEDEDVKPTRSSKPVAASRKPAEPMDAEDEIPVLEASMGPVAIPDEDDEEAELTRQLAAAKARKAAKTVETAAPKVETKPARVEKPAAKSKIADMTDEQFLSEFEDEEASRPSK